MESQSSWFPFQLCLCTWPFKKSCRESQRNSLSVWQSCEPDCRNATGALPMPFKKTTWLHETTAAFELLFWPLALLGIGCFSSRAEIIFFSWRVLENKQKSFCLCQSNLSLLLTVVCHLAVFNVWGVFSSNTLMGNWGHGEKEQLVQDHTAGNWQSEKLRPNPRLCLQSRDGRSYSFQARLALNLAKQGNLFLVRCFPTIQLGNIFFSNAAFPQWILAWLLLGA